MNTTTPAPRPAFCPVCGTPEGDCPICGTEGGCPKGHTDADHASYDAYLSHLASQCPVCGAGHLDTPGDPATCSAGHTDAELAAYAEWASGGEDHLPGCQEFADMGGEANCTCGGMGCDAGWTTGPREDPYGVSCQYIRRDHPRGPDGNLLHRGPDPLGDTGWLLEWTGGGTCVGDPLPHKLVRHLVECPAVAEPVRDEDLWTHMRDVHEWLMGGFERDDYSTLRAIHRVALENAARDAEAASHGDTWRVLHPGPPDGNNPQTGIAWNE